MMTCFHHHHHDRPLCRSFCNISSAVPSCLTKTSKPQFQKAIRRNEAHDLPLSFGNDALLPPTPTPPIDPCRFFCNISSARFFCNISSAVPSCVTRTTISNGYMQKWNPWPSSFFCEFYKNIKHHSSRNISAYSSANRIWSRV